MKPILSALIGLMAFPVLGQLPDSEQFRMLPFFPEPAANATGVVGTSLPDGRFILWNGLDVFFQRGIGEGVFDVVATGYTGDPGFITLSPDGSSVLMGAGFGDGTNANLYRLDPSNPTDFSPGDEIVVPSHFSGAFLNSDLIAIDRGDFGSPAEIVVLDVSTTTRGQTTPFTVIERPAPQSRDTVITKPSGSFSASVATDNGLLYVADSGNGQYKTFNVADVIDAFNTSTTIPWASGIDIGAPFQFPASGVHGFLASGNLVLSGFGSIVEVDPNTETIVKSIDPAGTGPFYGVIFNDVTKDLIAVEFPATFGDPLTFHATETAVATLPVGGWVSVLLLVFGVAASAQCALGDPPAVRAPKSLGRGASS